MIALTRTIRNILSGFNRNKGKDRVVPFLFIVLMCLMAFSSRSIWAASPGPEDIIVKKDPFDPQRGAGQSNGDDSVTQEDGLKNRYQVYGVFIVTGKKRAFLKRMPEQSTGRKYIRARRKTHEPEKYRILAVGDLLDGWKVKDITDKGVILESEGETLVLGVFQTPKMERHSTKPVSLKPSGASGVSDTKIRRLPSGGHKLSPDRKLPIGQQFNPHKRVIDVSGAKKTHPLKKLPEKP